MSLVTVIFVQNQQLLDKETRLLIYIVIYSVENCKQKMHFPAEGGDV